MVLESVSSYINSWSAIFNRLLYLGRISINYSLEMDMRKEFLMVLRWLGYLCAIAAFFLLVEWLFGGGEFL